MSVLIQVLCSYSTLPLYAIVTQMGSKFKREIFDVGLQETIHGWADDARKKKRTWGIRGRKSKDDLSSSKGAVQMQTMTVEAVDSAHIAHHAVDLNSITTVNEHFNSIEISEI
ncbi:Mlo15p [Asimina triloba]